MASQRFARWTKSRRSSGNDNCVEVGIADDGTIGVRDSKDPLGGILEFPPAAWASFLDDVRDGRFDI